MTPKRTVFHQNNLLNDRFEASRADLSDANAPIGLTRREWTRRLCTVAGAMSLPGILGTLDARSAFGAAKGNRFGPLIPTADQRTGLKLIALPEGFEYTTLSWAGDPMKGEGQKVPPLHDGMAAFVVGDDHVVLIRNQEISNGSPYAAPVFDLTQGGGTTNVLFNTSSFCEEKTWGSLTGTVRNCAGGPTPWNSWLTCEETMVDGHGWIFDVPVFGYNPPLPIEDMGRFSHEAVAVAPLGVDPSAVVYETEDAVPAGFYRFRPHNPEGLGSGSLREGGTLEMLAIKGNPTADLSVGVQVGEPMDVEWVPIADPKATTKTVFEQGRELGGASFERLEGAWYGLDEAANPTIFFDSTSGGAANAGQIFAYDIRQQTLKLIYESPDREILDAPDNLTVIPGSGDILLCEDGSRAKKLLHVLTQDGQICPFAENNVEIGPGQAPNSWFPTGNRHSVEWAGATFAVMPNGELILFVNIQTPGITFAIKGPFLSA